MFDATGASAGARHRECANPTKNSSGRRNGRRFRGTEDTRKVKVKVTTVGEESRPKRRRLRERARDTAVASE